MHLLKEFNVRILIKTIRLMGKRAWIFLLFILGFNIVEAANVPLSAFGLRGTIRGVTNGDPVLYRHSLILFVFGIALWWVYAPASAYMCDWASKKAVRNIKTEFAAHLFHLPQKYHDNRPTGE